MHRGPHRSLIVTLVAALSTVGWAYRDSFLSMAQKWSDDAAFSHGFLVLPISLWLVWQKRTELAAVPLRPSWLGAAMVALLVALWVVARGTGVLVVEQFAAVAMLPAMLLAILGRRAALCLAFPLGFLFFAVPFGRALVPVLMEVTADIATWALRTSGVPVYRSQMLISIPSGDFEVARACSGLNYVITGLVLGALYGYVSFAGMRKRAVCLAAFLLVPILANGIRVYVTIAVSHLTNMEFGPGHEHITFGRIFFVTLVLIMFWIGRRWHDARLQAVAQSTLEVPYARMTWVPVPVAILAVLIGPPCLAASADRAQAQLAGIDTRLSLPTARAPWDGPRAELQGWVPLYRGAFAERSGVYVSADGSRVDVFVGVYGINRTSRSEMISYGNRIGAGEIKSLAEESIHALGLADGQRLRVREQLIRDAGAERLVWYWFVVGDRPVASEFGVKVLEALAFVRRDAYSEQIVAISTEGGRGAGARLRSFLDAHGRCLVLGLSTQACTT